MPNELDTQENKKKVKLCNIQVMPNYTEFDTTDLTGTGSESYSTSQARYHSDDN